MSELDMLPEDVRAIIEHADPIMREAATTRALADWQAIRAYLLRVTAERDALRKRIEDAPKDVTWTTPDGITLANFPLPYSMAAKRVAIVVLNDAEIAENASRW